MILSHSSVQFSSPLPPPAILSAYNEAIPGLAGEIVSLIAQQTAHRQAQEKKELEANISFYQAEFAEARIGQVCALVIALSFLAGGLYVVLHGQPWPGAFIGSSGIVGLVAAFIKGRKE